MGRHPKQKKRSFLFVEHLPDQPTSDKVIGEIEPPQVGEAFDIVKRRYPAVAEAELGILTTGQQPAIDAIIDQQSAIDAMIEFMGIKWRTERFLEEDGLGPLYAMEAFLLAMNQGVYPPIYILKWIEEALKKYKRSHGQKKLEVLLGFKKSGKGNDVFENRYETDKDGKILFDLAFLGSYLGIRLEIKNGTGAYEICGNKHGLAFSTIRDKKSKNKSHYQDVCGFFYSFEKWMGKEETIKMIAEKYREFIDFDTGNEMDKALKKKGLLGEVKNILG